LTIDDDDDDDDDDGIEEEEGNEECKFMVTFIQSKSIIPLYHKNGTVI
jgi:hypothetical protein